MIDLTNSVPYFSRTATAPASTWFLPELKASLPKLQRFFCSGIGKFRIFFIQVVHGVSSKTVSNTRKDLVTNEALQTKNSLIYTLFFLKVLHKIGSIFFKCVWNENKNDEAVSYDLNTYNFVCMCVCCNAQEGYTLKSVWENSGKATTWYIMTQHASYFFEWNITV